jgi:hypothetical protein
LSYTNYPNAIDGYSSIPIVVDQITEINAITVNVLRSAIIAIEQELGTLPKGDYDSVRDRLDALETMIDDLSIGIASYDPVSDPFALAVR